MKTDIQKHLELKKEWPEVKNIMAELHKKGFQAVLAGGAVRDALLQKTPQDLDIATSARPEEILKIFPYAKGHFSKYAVVFLPLKSKGHIELATFRKDLSYTDGRRPQAVSLSSMEEDAKRRDFTINALFYDPQSKKIIDFTGGLEDLKKKSLRSVGQAKKRFEEDHLRVLRALRLAHQLDFQIDRDIQKNIPSFAGKIQILSKERIVEELMKMFSKGQIGSALKSLQKHKLFSSLFPSLGDPFKSPYIAKPFEFWNNPFSFYKDPAFIWTLFGLPFFYSKPKKFELFLKNLLLPSSQIKNSLSYLKAVSILTRGQSSFGEKIQAFHRQKAQVFELSDFWLKSQKGEKQILHTALKEFEKREQKGRLPDPLVRGADLLKVSPPLLKNQFSSLLKQAFEYQMEQPQAKKSEILKKILG